MIKTVAAPREFLIPLRIVHSPDMPAASKISERAYSWEEVRHIISTNTLEAFARSLEQTERYHLFKRELKQKKTTIFKHMLQHELQWFDPSSNDGITDILIIDDKRLKVGNKSTQLFACAEDLKILPNHFPYYFEPDVRHYCVWTKLAIPSDNSDLGDLTPETRAIIDAYVHKTFIEGLGISPDNLVWFRNWAALQSVQAISHIHVIIKGITDEQEQQILYTPGRPLTEEEYVRVKETKPSFGLNLP